MSPAGRNRRTLIEGDGSSYTLNTSIDDGAQFYALATNANGSTPSAQPAVTAPSSNLALNKDARACLSTAGGVTARR